MTTCTKEAAAGCLRPSEALDMVHAGLGYLAAADPAQLSIATQAECLRELEQADAVATAARAPFLTMEKFRDESDELLIAAAAAGLGLEDLAALSAEMYEQARGDLPDEDPDRDFADRGLKLATTFGGAGVVHGDLTPECAAAFAAVLDALSAPAGAEDDRTRDQRYHDALQEAMRRLAGSDLLPKRAGQPVKIWAHISLADLLCLDGSSARQEQWTAQVRAQWAARRAAASETGSDGAAWLDGNAAEAIACDAAMAPIVTGEVNAEALEDLVRLCVELGGRRDGARDAAWAALEQAVVGKTMFVLMHSVAMV